MLSMRPGRSFARRSGFHEVREKLSRRLINVEVELGFNASQQILAEEVWWFFEHLQLRGTSQ